MTLGVNKNRFFLLKKPPPQTTVTHPMTQNARPSGALRSRLRRCRSSRCPTGSLAFGAQKTIFAFPSQSFLLHSKRKTTSQQHKYRIFLIMLTYTCHAISCTIEIIQIKVSQHHLGAFLILWIPLELFDCYFFLIASSWGRTTINETSSVNTYQTYCLNISISYSSIQSITLLPLRMLLMMSTKS